NNIRPNVSKIMGFDFFDIDEVLFTGSYKVFSGNFLYQNLNTSLIARGYTVSQTDKLSVWCSPDCNSEITDYSDIPDPANFFGGGRGANNPIALASNLLFSSDSHPSFQRM